MEGESPPQPAPEFPPRQLPNFDGRSIPNRTYRLGSSVAPWQLPEATSGNGSLRYTLHPTVPGLVFAPTTRELSGTPVAVATYQMTYAATDDDGDFVTLQFTITVEPAPPGEHQPAGPAEPAGPGRPAGPGEPGEPAGPGEPEEPEERNPPEQACQDYEYQAVQVATGLAHPWSLAFLPDGDLLVTERGGKMKRIDSEDGSQAVAGLPAIAAPGQGGLLDVILDPSFAQNQHIYFAYSQRHDGGYRTAVARAQLNGNQLSRVTTIFAMSKSSEATNHFGARLAFLSDGDLVVTLGDRGERDRAQDPSDHAGSVLRIRPDGSVSPRTTALEIPDAAAEVFTFGHRNPQGLAIHPATEDIWIHEHGPRGGDEINILRGGANYGWPVVSYGKEYDTGKQVGEGTEKEGMESPLLHWTPSIAPSGMTFYEGDKFPCWTGDLFVGALAGRHLRRIELQDGAVVQQEVLLQNTLGRIRDVRNGPDGRLWLLTDASDGGIYRIERVSQ